MCLRPREKAGSLFAVATGNRLTDMEYDEVSLVTRPANQLSKVVLFKSDDTPSGSTDSTGEVRPSAGESTALETRMRSLREMRKDGIMDDDVTDYIATLEKTNEELFALVEKAAAPKKIVGGKRGFAAEEDSDEDMDEDDEMSKLLKSADPKIVELLKSAETRAVAAETVAKAEREHRREREFVEKAAEFEHLPITSDELGAILKSACDHLDEQSFSDFVDLLGKTDHMVSTGETLDEIGKAGYGASTVISKIDSAAEALIASDPTLTHEQAIEKAVMADPTLYEAYERGDA